jgi:hypothetical protein
VRHSDSAEHDFWPVGIETTKQSNTGGKGLQEIMHGRTRRRSRLLSQYAANPTTNAMPTFQTASAAVTINAKRSPLSLGISRTCRVHQTATGRPPQHRASAPCGELKAG